MQNTSKNTLSSKLSSLSVFLLIQISTFHLKVEESKCTDLQTFCSDVVSFVSFNM